MSNAALFATYAPRTIQPAGYPYTYPAYSSTTYAVWGALSTASMAASAYHGVKRNNGSVSSGIWWGLCGALFPVVTPVIALAQGYAEPARK